VVPDRFRLGAPRGRERAGRLERTRQRPRPELLLHCAKLAVRQNRLDDATRDLEAGLAGARAIGLPYEQALLLEEYAGLYAAQGERGKAREPIAQAVSIFDRLGAVPDAARAREAKFVLFSDRNENPASAPS
jgi:hypothetical protein